MQSKLVNMITGDIKEDESYWDILGEAELDYDNAEDAITVWETALETCPSEEIRLSIKDMLSALRSVRSKSILLQKAIIKTLDEEDVIND